MEKMTIAIILMIYAPLWLNVHSTKCKQNKTTASMHLPNAKQFARQSCCTDERSLFFFFYSFFCSCDTSASSLLQRRQPRMTSCVCSCRPTQLFSSKALVRFDSKALLERCSDFFSSLINVLRNEHGEERRRRGQPWGWTLWFNKPVRFLSAS